MKEAPIERLNYFNGQRLEAADFRVEQDYHVHVRQWLNKSLFSAGIGAGLEVEKVLPEPSHAVQVGPGFALDSLGREIILVAPRVVPVAGKSSKPGKPVTGNYLVLEYSEEPIARVADGCAVQVGAGCRAAEDLVWGAPSRILAEPRLFLQQPWPKPGENKIVLAQLDLDENCAVREIRRFVRKSVGPSQPASARVLAIEGEKDINATNPKELYFHIEGGAPVSALLYLRGAKFSTLFYTELGSHTHALHVTLSSAGAVPAHTHTLGVLTTDPCPSHSHTITANTEDTEGHNALELGGDDAASNLNTKVNLQVSPEGGHTHTIPAGAVTNPGGVIAAHTHALATATVDPFGVASAARSGAPLEWINALVIELDGTDITPLLLQQLNDRDGAGSWPSLGKGTGAADDTLNASDATGKTDGTREIDLLRAGVDLSPGEHRLTFHVAAGGGRIQYNLYIG